MNIASLARSVGSALSSGRSATGPRAPQPLTDVVRRLYRENASSGTAALALESATNRFCLKNWRIPSSATVQTLNVTLRQDVQPGLDAFRREVDEASLYLANQPTGPLKSAIATNLGLASFKCHNAEVLWGSRIMRAHSENDPETVAFATLILGEHHPTVAHVQAAVYDALTPPLHTARQMWEAVPSEAAEIWEHTGPLNDGMEAEAPQLPAAHAPCMQIERSRPTYNNPQDPSIERLLLEREDRSRPRHDFLRNMLGTPPA